MADSEQLEIEALITELRNAFLIIDSGVPKALAFAKTEEETRDILDQYTAARDAYWRARDDLLSVIDPALPLLLRRLKEATSAVNKVVNTVENTAKIAAQIEKAIGILLRIISIAAL